MIILIEAGYIPDGTTVYKKTGETPFIIRDMMKIYTYGTAKKESDKSDIREVNKIDGCKFIIDGRGNVNIVGNDTILKINLEIKNDYEDNEEEIDVNLLESILSSRLKKEVEITAYLPQ